MKKLILALCAAFLAVSLTACGGFGKQALSDADLRAILVTKLASDCSSLNAWMIGPENWELVGSTPTGGGSEYALYGDGGAIALDVIPDGVGGANVVIADVYAYVTNINLYNSGCRTLAKAPAEELNSDYDMGGGDSSNVEQTGHYEQRCTQQMVPNPQYDPMASPGVMSMKGITQYIYENQCTDVWVD